ncbi:MAG TPA: DUF4062 domain-containing protein [Pyrinomonadaceae bacterium]|nr:DUF4062 domain-containing protein [Pyrinomonadaceae bacterium]
MSTQITRSTRGIDPNGGPAAQVKSPVEIETWGENGLKPLSRDRTAQVFISSLNGYRLRLAPGDRHTLTDLRKHLVNLINKNFRFLSTAINEDMPATGAGNPRKTTQYLARTCHIFIGILVDSYGFRDKSGLSATLIEFDAAYEDSPEKMLIFIQESLHDTKSATYKKQPPPYKQRLEELQGYAGGKLVNGFETWEELPGLILKALDRYCADTLRAIRLLPPYASDKSAEEANWEQMTFSERHEEMLRVFRSHAWKIRLDESDIDRFSRDPDGDDPHRYRLAIRQGKTRHHLPVVLSACPDRFAHPDAAGYVGYPFRTRVESWDKRLGPLDIILFYRTATDSQIRRHLGNPDIHVTKEDWGYFAADPERYIQAAYLLNCTSSRELERKVRQFLTWLDEYGQVKSLLARARVRGRILRAEN